MTSAEVDRIIVIQSTFKGIQPTVEAPDASYLNLMLKRSRIGPLHHLLPLLTTLALLPGTALAQAGVDAGTLLREAQKPVDAAPLLAKPPPIGPAAKDKGPQVTVNAFEVSGSTLYGPEVWSTVLSDLVGKSQSFSALQAAADRVSQHYRSAGLHALAFLPEQNLTSGRVRIVVVEGRLGGVQISSPKPDRLPMALLSRMLGTDQTVGKVVNIDALERATLIANDIPGIKVSSVLTAGKQAGETDIEANAEALAVFGGNGTIDNFDPISTGKEKVTGQLVFSNALGWGEQTQISLQASAGKRYGQLSYNLPLAANGMRGGLNLSRLDYTLQKEFGQLGGMGNADTWGAFLSYPVIRAQQHNLSGQMSYSASHLVNSATAGNISDKKSQSLTLGLSGNDYGSGDGVTIGGISLVAGEVDLSGNTAELAQDAAGPSRNGRYAKAQFNIARLQRLSANGMLWLSANGQVAGKNLDSGEEFSLGGPNGVRAFPALEAAGDQGLVLTAEYRYEISSVWRPKLFIDLGHITVNRDNSFTGAPAFNDYQLKGAGMGLDWTPSRTVTVRAHMAWRIAENPNAQANGNDADGTRHLPQVWLQAYLDF